MPNALSAELGGHLTPAICADLSALDGLAAAPGGHARMRAALDALQRCAQSLKASCDAGAPSAGAARLVQLHAAFMAAARIVEQRAQGVQN